MTLPRGLLEPDISAVGTAPVPFEVWLRAGHRVGAGAGTAHRTGKFGVSVWTTVLLDKFLYGRPSHRLIEDPAQLCAA